MRQLLLALALVSPCQADDFFAKRPAFSPAEMPAASTASCEELRAMAAGVQDTETRVDLTVGGRLTLIKSDGVLWYLVVCSDLRIMCITYQANGMKVGDPIVMKGGYRRLDPNHAVLDPCLANTAE